MSIFFEPGFVSACLDSEKGRLRVLFRISPHAQYGIVEFPAYFQCPKGINCEPSCSCWTPVINSVVRSNTYGAIGNVLSELTDDGTFELLHEDSLYELGLTRNMVIARGRYYLELTDQP